ncbi:MAG TPA: TetR/AcrR family transcriptional regulator [Bacillota bacterium]|nr:TetR/AcrR family transcriptional regulator [Bacillota bacterium]HOL10958.1 TetR/AcrR family transcriptional regulator [Bacillota bacterium]HPO98713.1 TetR/AcrR family transcriptional regulator [Bacillota bacterium]
MAEDRKAEILQAFKRLVSQFGLDKTTMQDIAKEAGVSVGVIYKDYANKEELIDAYADSVIKRFVTEYQKIINTSSSPEQQLHDLVVGAFKLINQTIIEDLGFHQILADDNSLKYVRKNFSRKKEIEEHLTKTITEILQDGVTQKVFRIEDIQQTAVLFLEAFDGYFIKILLGGGDMEYYLPKIEMMFEFLLKNIKGR